MGGMAIAFFIETFLLDLVAYIYWRDPCKAYHRLSRGCFIASIPMCFGFLYCTFMLINSIIYGG